MALPVLGWAAIWGFVSAIIRPVTKAVVTALGLSLVVYTGLDFIFDQAFQEVESTANNLPDIGIYVLKAVGFFTALKMWAAAIAGVIAFRALNGGAKMIWKRPAA